jgi:hypothetical protein
MVLLDNPAPRPRPARPARLARPASSTLSRGLSATDAGLELLAEAVVARDYAFAVKGVRVTAGATAFCVGGCSVLSSHRALLERYRDVEVRAHPLTCIHSNST